jgi:hypothetical protein
MVEKKIYDSWAFAANADEKGEMNYVIYKELLDKYKVACSTRKYNALKNCFEDIDLSNYEVVVQHSGVGYAHTLYKVIKNEPNLSTLELALICDDGNLCFGYSMRGNMICIHTD